MKPAARRRVEREVHEIMERDGDNCSLCRKPMEHNSKTFGGTTKVGTSALVGECCERQLAEVVLMGVFVSGDDDLATLMPTGKGRQPRPHDAEQAVDAIQGLFAKAQSEVTDLVRRAGVPQAPAKIFRQETAWKDDDARWFEQHPARSHRLRQPIADEAEKSNFAAIDMPARHELQVLVRQIEPGQRMRVPFGRNLDVPIPDDEIVLHALFDIVVSQRGGGPAITGEAMAAAIERYSGKGSARPS